MSSREHILQLIEPVVASFGLDLEDVEIKQAGKHSIVQIFVDKDGGIDLDQVAQVSSKISETLDEKEAMGERAYTLDVGSPGIDRPLVLERHWRRNIGRLVKINSGSNSDIGRIISINDDQVVVDVKGKERVFSLDKIDNAFIQIEFNPKKRDK